jgi:hypothetical protein
MRIHRYIKSEHLHFLTVNQRNHGTRVGEVGSAKLMTAFVAVSEMTSN